MQAGVQSSIKISEGKTHIIPFEPQASRSAARVELSRAVSAPSSEIMLGVSSPEKVVDC